MMRKEHRSLSPLLIMWRTSSRLAGALTTFSQGFFRYLVLQHRFCQEPLEPSILGFQFLEALGIRHVHAAKLAAPEVIAGL